MIAVHREAGYAIALGVEETERGIITERKKGLPFQESLSEDAGFVHAGELLNIADGETVSVRIGEENATAILCI